ncbi:MULTISPECIES: hypothetical protein [unclassified Ruegeria]|uniref:hypothetical protein n=1 Tax=unclassified Ruegeria TaxID=2625375 RepID=UPI0014926F52|nr:MULTISPECIES: hypothetical protein [unclassified Ruegeria]NOD75044.1 hypothetical protein [Ruegeria sp. HKCCD4332]NOG09275.1 hypothetical protein [Ruegeria sp. HKCCD4315]
MSKRRFSANLATVGRLSDIGWVFAHVFLRQPRPGGGLGRASLNVFSESIGMPNVTQHGSFKKTVGLDEDQILDRLAELSVLSRSKGYVHSARMIEEAQKAYAFESKHLAAAEMYRSELLNLTGFEISRSSETSEMKQSGGPSFRSRRSRKPEYFRSDVAQRSVESQGQRAFVLTAGMRIESRKVTALRGQQWAGKPMRFPAEPEFKFR